MTDDALQREGKSRHRRSRVGVFAALAGCVAIFCGILAYRHYTNPARIRTLAETYLQQFTNGRVHVGAASFSLFRDLRLFDVTIEEFEDARPSTVEHVPSDDEAAPPAPVFACRQLQLKHEPLPALFGRLKIVNVVATSPSLSIVYDVGARKTNLAGLLRPHEWRGEEPIIPPTIELREARVHVVAREGGRERDVEDLQLTVRGRCSLADKRFYDIVWQRDDSMDASGHSQVDLRSGDVRNVRGGLPYLSIDAVMLAVDANYDGAGAWVNILGLDGAVRACDYDLTGSSSKVGVRSASIELRGTTLSVPIDDEERTLPRERRFLRFDNVDGTVLVSADGIRAEFSGRLHGSNCRVAATLRGGMDEIRSLDDVELDLALTADSLELPRPDDPDKPEQARFIHRWKHLADFYRYYDPRGRVDLEFAATKTAGLDGTFALKRARITARGGSASCLWAPYRGDYLSGSLELGEQGIFLRNLRGHHDGGFVTVEGWLSGPDHCSEAELFIKGENITFDDDLYTGLPQRFARVIEEFNPCGRFDFAAELRRGQCVDGVREKWDTLIDGHFAGITAQYDHFPYPLREAAGEISIVNDHLWASNMQARTPNDEGTVSVDADAVFPQDVPPVVQVEVRGGNIEIDRTLIDALPPAVAQTVTSLRPGGRADLVTRLNLDETTSGVQHETRVSLFDVSIMPEAFPIPIDRISGSLRINRARVELDSLAGRYRDAGVRVSGMMSLQQSRWKLGIDASDLEFDEPLRMALPAEWRERIEDWRVTGPIHLKIAAHADSETQPKPSVAVEVSLNRAAVAHRLFPVPFEDVTGRVFFEDQRAQGFGIEALYGLAPVHLAFEANHTEQEHQGTISARIGPITLNQSVRDVLPALLRPAWDRLAPRGLAELRIQALRFSRNSAQRSYVWSLEAIGGLQDVDVLGVSEVTDLTGTVSISGMAVDRQGGLALSGRFQNSDLRLFGRRLQGATGDWAAVQTATGRGHFAVENFQAGIYGGTAMGKLALETGSRDVDYNLVAALQNVAISPLLAAGRSSPAQEEMSDVRGKADVSFYLTGQLDQPESRRGGGGIELREGYIHKLPIMLAIWSVLNANIPSQETFDAGEARFLISGQRAEIQAIRLDAGSLELVGNGVLSLPDMAVDLNLVSKNRQRLARIPGLTELVEGAMRELVELHVTGPISRPMVRIAPLRGIGDEFKQLFRKKKPTTIKPASG